MENYLFEKTSLFLRSTEERLITQTKSDYPIIRNMQRFFLFPLGVIRLGAAEIFKSWATWCLIMFPVIVLLGKFNDFTNSSYKESANGILGAVAVLVIFSLLFSAPSRYDLGEKAKPEIEDIIKLLRDMRFDTTPQIEFLKKNISINEDRVRRHIVPLRWLAALLWAAFLYFLSKIIDLALAESAINMQAHIPNFMFFILALFVVVPCLFGYEAGIHRFYQIIDIACHEVEYELLVNTTSPRI